jgi:hypothetical protein
VAESGTMKEGKLKYEAKRTKSPYTTTPSQQYVHASSARQRNAPPEPKGDAFNYSIIPILDEKQPPLSSWSIRLNRVLVALSMSKPCCTLHSCQYYSLCHISQSVLPPLLFTLLVGVPMHCKAHVNLKTYHNP